MANLFSRSALSSSLTRTLRGTSSPQLTQRLANLTRSSPSYLYPLQLRHLSDETRSALTSATKSSPIVLFMKGTPDLPQCGFSRTTLQILGLQGVDPSKFTAYNVLEDQELRQGIKEFSNWPTIPQLYVDGEFVGGCDVVMEMHKDGSLSELLEGKGLVVTEEGDGEEGK